ncbi:MAG: Gfo/Idh/MocA family oxidoreductase [Gemmatimonadetes bacterium]|nr:Gfo/Idh/MocA family oxidoreductase [Gemmatimonadota bacterium]
MNEIRIGIAGLGHRSRHWINTLLKIPGYRITALYDWIEPLHDRALSLIEYRNDVRVFRDYEDFLAYEGMDAVGRVVRRKDQGAMAAQALEAGKHVNMEVPAAHTMEDCWRIVTAAEHTGRVYQLAEQTRYWGFVEAWRDMVAEGRLGRVTYCEGQYIGYYGTRQFFQDYKTGQQYSVEELSAHPDAEPTWLHVMPPIHYLPHELSPMLKVLDDRVVEVTAMSTASPSYSHPEIDQPDIQVALMKTEKDRLLRMVTGFTQKIPSRRGHHWYQIIGTRGCVEWKRSEKGRSLMWLADSQMHDLAEVDWKFERTDAPAEAQGSGHGDADYYVHTAFWNAVVGNKPLEFDVYRAMETAAPAVLAAESIARGTELMKVPDFRPNETRPSGQMPGGD